MIAHRAFELNPDQTKIVSSHGKIMVFDCPFLVYSAGVEAYKNGRLIQDAFPMLDDDEREFLLSGLLPEEFDALCDELEAHENILYSTGELKEEQEE